MDCPRSGTADPLLVSVGHRRFMRPCRAGRIVLRVVVRRSSVGAGGRAPSGRRSTEPVYYLKIALRTARFAERGSAIVLRDRFESRHVAQQRTSGRVYREKNRDG